MSDWVAAECWVTKASFQIELKQFQGCLETLDVAARFIDAADTYIQGVFYYQRARVYKELGRIDAAITDYSGAAAYLGMVGRKDCEALTRNSLALLYLKIGDVNSARSNIDQALSISPSDSQYECQIHDTLAEIQLAEGQLGAALTSVDKALSLVGENELWRAGFVATRDKIESELLRVLGVEKIQDLDTVRASMTRRALTETGGNLQRAGKLLGLTHKGVDWIISKHPELERYRPERQTRLKSIIKQPE
jgi:tetratricopeptide (TPR) repeat protein